MLQGSLGSGPAKRSPNVASSGVNALRRTTLGSNPPKVAAKLPQPPTARISLKGPSNKPMPLGAYGMLRPENEGLNDLPVGGWGSGTSSSSSTNTNAVSSPTTDSVLLENSTNQPRSSSTSPSLGPSSSYSGNLPIPSMLPSATGEWFDEISKTESSLRSKVNSSSNFSSSMWPSSSVSPSTATNTSSAPGPSSGPYTHSSSPPNPSRSMGSTVNNDSNRRYDDNSNNRFNNPSSSPMQNQHDRYRSPNDNNTRNFYSNNQGNSVGTSNGPWRNNNQDWSNIRDMGSSMNYTNSSFDDHRGRSTERSNELNTTTASSITNRSSTERGGRAASTDDHARLVATRIVGGASTRIVTPSKPSTIPEPFNKSVENLTEYEIEQLRRQEEAAQLAALEAERLASEAESRAEHERLTAEQRERDRLKALEYQAQEMRRRERQRQQTGGATGTNPSAPSHTQPPSSSIAHHDEDDHRRASVTNQRTTGSTSTHTRSTGNVNMASTNPIINDEGTTSIKILSRPANTTTSNVTKAPRQKSLYNHETGEFEEVDESKIRHGVKMDSDPTKGLTTSSSSSSGNKQTVSRTGPSSSKDTDHQHHHHETVTAMTNVSKSSTTTVIANTTSSGPIVKNVWEEKRRAAQAAAEAQNQAATEAHAQLLAEARAQKQHHQQQQQEYQRQAEAREAEERAERIRKAEEAKAARKAARAHEKATRGPRTRGALFHYNTATNEIIEIDPINSSSNGGSVSTDGKDLNTSKSSLGFHSNGVNLLPVLSNPGSSLDYGNRRRSTDIKQADHDSGLPLQSLLLGTLMDEVEGNNDMNTSNLGFQMLNNFGNDTEVNGNNANKDNRGMKDIVARNPGLVGTTGNIMIGGDGTTNPPTMLPNSIISFSAIPGAMAPPNPVTMDMAQIFAQQQQDPNLQPRNILQIQQPSAQPQGQQIPQQQMYNFANYFYNMIPGTNMIQGQEQMMAAMGMPPNVQLFHPAFPAFSTGGNPNIGGNPGMELIRGPPMTSFPMQPPTGHFTLQPATLQPAHPHHRNLIPATVMIDNSNPNGSQTVSALNPSASLWQPSNAVPSDPWMARHTVPAPTWGSGVLGMGMMGIPNTNGPNPNNGTMNNTTTTNNNPSQAQPSNPGNDNRVWSSFGQTDNNTNNNPTDNTNNNNNGNNNATSSFLKPAAAVETGGGLKLIPTSMMVPNSSTINTTSFWQQQQQQVQQQASMFNPIMTMEQAPHLGLKFQNMSLLDGNDMDGNNGYDMNNYNNNYNNGNNLRGGLRGGMSGTRGGSRGGSNGNPRNYPNEYDDRQTQQQNNSMRGGRGGGMPGTVNGSTRGGSSSNNRGGYRPPSAGGSPSKL